MKDKYYTPEIEEFYVGFEFEMLHVNSEEWLKKTVKGYKEIRYVELLPNKFRVKYLDREDIESLGFEFKYNEKGNENIAFTKKYDNHPRYDNQYVDVIWNYASSHVLICEGDNETGWDEWITRFSGTIKNKSELKKVLKMLNIN